MAINLSNISQYFQYPDKVAELKNRLYLILRNKGIEVTANESLNSLIEKVREVEPALEPQTIYLTQNNTSYDVTEYTEAIVDVPPVTVENDLDGLIDGSLTSFTMPSTISSFTTERFNNFSQLSTVIAPEVTYIPGKTFQQCISLENINLPNATVIEDQAFNACVKLSEINLDATQHLGNSCFKDCTVLKSISISKVLEIKTDAFNNCRSLSEISANSVTTIRGTDTFKNTNLTTFNFPNVQYINSLNLQNCLKLSYISLPNIMNIEWLVLPPNLVNTAIDFSLLSTLNFTPNTATAKGALAWLYNCDSLENINLPILSYINAANTYWFIGSCNNISNINLSQVRQFNNARLADNLPKLETVNLNKLSYTYNLATNSSNYFINNCPNLSNINCAYLSYIPSYFVSNNKLSSIALDNAGFVGVNAFYSLSLLQKVTSPVLSSILTNAFKNCSLLSDYIFSNIDVIASNAFDGCIAMSLPIYMTSTSIQDNAFFNCNNLTEIYFNTMSTTVTGISSNAFSNCGIMTNANGKIIVPSDRLSLFKNTYSNYSFSDKFVAMSDGYAQDKVFAYEYVNNAMTEIPASKLDAKILYKYAFSNCSKLSGTISLSQVEYIDRYVFYNLSQNGNSITFDLPKCKVIRDYAFGSIRASISFSLPELEYLGSYAMGGSSQYGMYYRTLYMPKVKYIGQSVFRGNNTYYPDRNRITLLSPNLSELVCLSPMAFMQCYLEVSDGILSMPKLDTIQTQAFYSMYGTSLSIYAPEVVTVESQAFNYCNNLNSITFSKVEVIENNAFASCYSLKTVDTLYNCKYIGDYAFYSDYNLSIEVSSPNLVKIGNYAFCSTKITAVNAPELASLGEGAFSMCTSIISAYLPKIYTVLNNQFGGCQRLSDLTMNFSAVSSVGASAFRNCSALSELILSNASIVGSWGFAYCSTLSKLILSPRYSKIEPGTFAGCINLNFDSMDLTKITVIGSNAFVDCDTLSSINNNYLFSLQDSTFTNCNNLSEVILPNVVQIGQSVFTSCHNLSSLVLNYSLISSVPNYAFAYCSKLSDLHFGQLTTLGTGGFYSCTGLTSFDLVDVTTVPTEVFAQCYNLSSINLSKVKNIGTYAFTSCKELQTVELNSIESIGACAFMNCTKLSIDIPNLSVIESSTYQRTAITSINNSIVNVIKASAFDGCSYLSQVSLPNVTSLETGAFANCSILDMVYIPNISSLSSYTFASTAISALPTEIDTNLTIIPSYCFYGCNYISTITLSNIKQINNMAFGSCKGIQDITLSNITNLVDLAINAFNGCSNLEIVNLPNITELRSFTLSTYQYQYPVIESTGYNVFGGCSIRSINAPKCSQFGYYIFPGLSNTLEYINLPKCTSIYDTFYYYTKLKTANLNQLISAPQNLFANNYSLENVNIEHAIHIGNYAFSNCYKLSEINIPNANIIGVQAFANCSSLISVQLGIIDLIDQYGFQNCYSLKTLNCEFIADVANYTFGYCSNLENITIASCGYAAFSNCKNLSKVNLLTMSGNAINNFSITFANTPMLSSDLLGYYGSIYVPYSALSLFRANYPSYSERFEELDPTIASKYIFAYNYYNKSISLADINISASYLLKYAFYSAQLTDCSELTFSNIKQIGTSAFQNCSTLTKLEAPNCKYVGSYAFYNCSNLSVINLPEVYNIGDNAFYGCTNLKIISLPKLSYSFYGNGNIEEIYLDRALSVSVAGAGASLRIVSAPNAIYWMGPTRANLTCINLPKLSYVRMSMSSNYGANLLSSQLSTVVDYFNIGASFVDIRSYILQGRTFGSFIMSQIKNVPNSFLNRTSISYAEFLEATSVDSYAFQSATLGTVVLPKVKTINSYAFDNVMLSTSMSLPEVTSVRAYALQSARGFSELALPKCSYVDQYAFRYASITTLKLGGNMSLGTTTYTLGGTNITNIVFNSNISYLSYGYQMADNTKLARVVFRGDILDYGTWYDATTVFANTPMSTSTHLGYYGSIYVPSSLIDKYQSIFSTYYNRITTIEAHEAELRELGLLD